MKKISYKLNIDDIIIDDINDLYIIDRKMTASQYIKKDGHQNIFKNKFYKIHCKNCNAELWENEKTLIQAQNKCLCCSGKIVIKGINDINTKRPDLIKYFKDIEETYLYTEHSDKKIICKCPNCGYKKIMKISNMCNRGFSCPSCSDGISYPNKFMFNLLTQLKIPFESEKTFPWCNYIINGKETFGIYDFYIPEKKIIIEMDGGLHYKDYKNSKEKDLLKNQKAKEHGFFVIRIDSNYSDINYRFEYIKENVINTLSNIFDLSNVNWSEINEKSSLNLLLQVCKIKKQNPNIKNVDLAKQFNVSQNTIIRWLKCGKEMNLYDYQEKKVVVHKILCKNNGMIFPSLRFIEKNSIDIFGVQLYRNAIADVCNGKKENSKGFSFCYL